MENLGLVWLNTALQLRGTDEVEGEMEEIAEDYRKTNDDKSLGGKGDNKLTHYTYQNILNFLSSSYMYKDIYILTN